MDVVLPTEAGLGRSSKRNIPYVAIYNNNLRIEYTQELGNNGDKVRRYLELKSKDTAIVTGEISKGREQQHKERDLIIIPPLRVKYSTYHQQRKVSARNKSSRRRSAARSDSTTTPVYYMFMSEFPTRKLLKCHQISQTTIFWKTFKVVTKRESLKKHIMTLSIFVLLVSVNSVEKRHRGEVEVERRQLVFKRRLVLDRDNEYF